MCSPDVIQSSENQFYPHYAARRFFKSRFENYIQTIHSKGLPVDVNALVQAVLRQAYLENTEDLHFYAEKVRFYNELKKSVRERTTKMRTLQSELAGAYNEDGSVNLDLAGQKASTLTTNFSGNAMNGNPISARDAADQLWRNQYGGGYVEFSAHPGAGNSVQSTVGNANDEWYGAGASDRLDTMIQNSEEDLNGIGDDAQLANVDLQNMLQKQQQTLQMLSNISKMLHDTAMATIRKIGG